MFKTGENPRSIVKNHRERGPVRFWFTLRDIANAAGVSMDTVYKHRSLGKLDPTDFADVARYMFDRWERMQ